jgi:hypothetical protein
MFDSNETVTLIVNYLNATGSNAQVAFSSPQIPKNLGYYVLPIDGAWLQGGSRNEVVLELVVYNPSVDAPATTYSGPYIYIVTPSASSMPANTGAPMNDLGLKVGIPVAIVTFLAILGCVYYFNRRKRGIDVGGLRALMGRKRGYGVRKSRRQRMGSKSDAFTQEAELNDIGSGHPAPDANEGNVFRAEIARQQEGRGL